VLSKVDLYQQETAGENTISSAEKKMTQIADLVSRGLADSSDEDHLAKAWAILGLLIGGINVSRAMKGGNVADEVANATIAAVIKIAS
jgi:hypothetical protein